MYCRHCDFHVPEGTQHICQVAQRRVGPADLTLTSGNLHKQPEPEHHGYSPAAHPFIANLLRR